jgi:hypothetical protein
MMSINFAYNFGTHTEPKKCILRWQQQVAVNQFLSGAKLDTWNTGLQNYLLCKIHGPEEIWTLAKGYSENRQHLVEHVDALIQRITVLVPAREKEAARMKIEQNKRLAWSAKQATRKEK